VDNIVDRLVSQNNKYLIHQGVAYIIWRWLQSTANSSQNNPCYTGKYRENSLYFEAIQPIYVEFFLPISKLS